MVEDRPRITTLLRSTAGTGTVYATTKNRRTTPGTLALRPYDRAIRQHVLFTETRAWRPRSRP
jgi:large subunit ribosomal protein L33